MIICNNKFWNSIVLEPQKKLMFDTGKKGYIIVTTRLV